jgi:hypothetical protein
MFNKLEHIILPCRDNICACKMFGDEVIFDSTKIFGNMIEIVFFKNLKNILILKII